MKKLILSLFVLVALTVLTNNAMAQYGIPSYDVPVIADPTTFEEVPAMSSQTISPFAKVSPFSQQPPSDGEVKLSVDVIDTDIATTAIVIIEIYSIDGSITYGPYTVYEGTLYTKMLNSSYSWGVKVLSATEESEMSVWFD